MQRPDKTLDIKGIAGRRASVLAGQALEPMPPGQVLKLITTDRDAKDGIVALCRDAGYSLLDELVDGSLYVFLIQR